VYVGLCADPQRAERDGPLRTGRMFCACEPCTRLDFAHCELTSVLGHTRNVQVPLPRGAASRVGQIESLEEWASLLKPGMMVGVRATGAEQHLEGPVWLLLIESEAFPMPEDLVHASVEYEAGWLVVHGRWFELEQRSPRGYKLNPRQVLVVVNSMIRLPNVVFAGGAVGKAPRATRSGLFVIEEDMYNLLLESV